MPEHRTDTAATPAPDDTLRDRLADQIAATWHELACGSPPSCGQRNCEAGGSMPRAQALNLADALLPLIREHTAAAAVGTPGPNVDLIEHAAGIIVAEKKKPHTAPYHWAGALWEAGMLVPPGHGHTNAGDDSPDLAASIARVLAAAGLLRPFDGDGDQIDAVTVIRSRLGEAVPDAGDEIAREEPGDGTR